jgi:2-polyprenyl-3-methyl-5-hydroxy-6-metoxy-1,4-benzoquinol methylase
MREIERCPICKEAARQVVYQETLDTSNIAHARRNPYGAHYRINRCNGCGLLYSSPIFDDTDIAALYEQAPHVNVMAGEERNVHDTMRLYYEMAKPHLRDRGRILDIGCDIGLMLDFARADGFRDLHGLEPNPVARRIAEAIPGASISEKFYEDVDFAESSFDLITFIHVIDHLIDPSKVVERAFRHLKPGGLVVAVVHNIESVLAKGLGERFPPFNLYHHYFFSKRTLAALFSSRGFEPIAVQSTKNCYSFGFFTRRLPGIPDAVRSRLAAGLDAIGVGRIPVTLSVGNIGIVARRP